MKIKNERIKQILLLLGGGGIGQVVLLVFSPVLSRIYSPAEWGIMGTFATLLSIYVIVLSFRYDQAIVLPKHKKSAYLLASLSLALLFITTGISVVLIFWGHMQIVWLLDAPVILGQMLFLFPVALLVIGFVTIQRVWATRTNNFKSLAGEKISRPLTQTSFQLGLGLMGFGAWGLVIGRIMGEFIGSVSLFLGDPKFAKVLHRKFWKTKWAEYLPPIQSYKDFAIFQTPQSLLNAISQGAPILVLGYVYNIEIAGLYTYTIRSLLLPANMIANSVRQVAYADFSQRINAGQALSNVYVSVTRLVLLAGIGPTIVVFIFGTFIFSLVFGQEWEMAGQFAEWLVLWVFTFVLNPIAIVSFRVLRQQGFLLIYDFVLLIVRVAVLFGVGSVTTPLNTIIAFTAVGVMFNLFLIVYGFVFVKRFDEGKVEVTVD